MHFVYSLIIDSAPLEEEHNIQEEIKMMCSVGTHENVVGLLRACTAEGKTFVINDACIYLRLYCV